MGEISGVPTADIDNVDGFFTTQGTGSGTTTTAPTITVTTASTNVTALAISYHTSPQLASLHIALPPRLALPYVS